MILIYKYCLKGKRSCRQLRRMAWAVNQVWNYCVATQRSVQRAWSSGLSPRWPSQTSTSTRRRSRVFASNSQEP